MARLERIKYTVRSIGFFLKYLLGEREKLEAHVYPKLGIHFLMECGIVMSCLFHSSVRKQIVFPTRNILVLRTVARLRPRYAFRFIAG